MDDSSDDAVAPVRGSLGQKGGGSSSSGMVMSSRQRLTGLLRREEQLKKSIQPRRESVPVVAVQSSREKENYDSPDDSFDYDEPPLAKSSSAQPTLSRAPRSKQVRKRISLLAGRKKTTASTTRYGSAVPGGDVGSAALQPALQFADDGQTLDVLGNRVASTMHELMNCNDEVAIMESLGRVGDELAHLAMVELQVWLVDSEGTLWSRRKDGVHIKLGGQNLEHTFGTPEHPPTSDAGAPKAVQVQHLKLGHGSPEWPAATKAMAALRLDSEQGLLFRSGWKFIHVLTLPNLSVGTTGNHHLQGVLVAVEVVGAQFSVSRLKTSFAVQILNQIAYGIVYRLRFVMDNISRDNAVRLQRRLTVGQKIESFRATLNRSFDPTSILVALVKGATQMGICESAFAVFRRTDCSDNVGYGGIGYSVTVCHGFTHAIDNYIVDANNGGQIETMFHAHVGAKVNDAHAAGLVLELTRGQSYTPRAENSVLVSYPVALRPPGMESAVDPQCLLVLVSRKSETVEDAFESGQRLAVIGSTAYSNAYRKDQMQKLDILSSSLDRVMSLQYNPVQQATRGNTARASVDRPFVSLLNHIVDESFSSHFDARSSRLLLSESVLHGLDLVRHAPSSADLHNWYVATGGESFALIGEDQGARGAYSLPSVGDLAKALLEQDACVGVRADDSSSSADKSLVGLLKMVDPGVSTAVFVPIHTRWGPAVLVLLDKDTATYPLCGSFRTDMLNPVFTEADLELFGAAAISRRLSLGFESTLNLQDTLNSAEDGRVRLAAMERLSVVEARLTRKERGRVMKLKVLKEWRSAIENIQAMEGRSKEAQYQHMLLALLQSVSSTMQESDFFASMEVHLAKLFPAYSVSVRRGSPVDNTDGDRDGEAPFELVHGYPLVQVQRPLPGADIVRPVILGLVNSVNGRRDFGGDEYVAAHVKLYSSRNDTDLHPDKTFASLSYVCEMCAAVYAVTQGARSLALPFFLKVFPAMLGKVDGSDTSVKMVTNVLSMWSKVMCGAEQATVRLNAGSSGEVLASSSDMDASCMHDMASEAEGKMATFVQDSVTEGGREASRIVLKLRDGYATSGDGDLGELRLLAGTGVAFNEDQYLAAQAVAFVLSHSLSTAHRIRNLGASDKQLSQQHSETVKSLRETMRVLETERDMNDDLKNKVAGLAGVILTFQRSINKVNGMQELGALCSNDLPTVIGCRSAVLLLFNSKGLDAGTFTPVLDTQDQTRITTLDSVQVHQIPLFAAKAQGRFQSKLLLTTGPEKPPFGLLLCFHDTGVGDEEASSSEQWLGLEKLLGSGISCMVSAALSKIEHGSVLAGSAAAAENMERLQEQETLLKAKLEDVSAEKESLREAHVEQEALAQSLQRDIHTGDLRFQEHKKVSFEAAKATKEEVQALKYDVEELHENATGQALMVEDLALSSLNKLRDPVAWLGNVAIKQKLVLHSVQQHEGGSLSGVDGISGLIPSVTECLRTGEALEFESIVNYSTVVALCVPNRTIYAMHESDHACFVFLRAGTDRFTKGQKDLLTAATYSTCAVMQYMNVEDGPKAILDLQKKLTSETMRVERNATVLAAVDQLWSQGYHSRLQLIPAFENVTAMLLTRGSGDSCRVYAKLWYPQGLVHTLNATTCDGIEKDEMPYARQACNTSAIVRKGMMMFVPIIFRDGVVGGLMRLERRLHDVHGDGSGKTLVDETMEFMGHMSEVLFTDDEETLMSDYSKAVLHTLEAVDILENAMQGVGSASEAIQSLQEMRRALEEKVSVEMGYRLKLQETLRAGSDLIGWSNSERATVLQLLDQVRKTCSNVSAAAHALVIAPVNGELEPTMANGAKALDTFWTLEANRDQPTMVALNAGDLEQKVLLTGKCMSTGGAGEAPCASWTARWVKENDAAESSLDYATGDGGSMDSNLCIVAVPLIFTGGSRGVIVCARRDNLFSAIDRECLLWTARVLVFCLERSWGGETMGDCRRMLIDSRREMDHLNARLERCQTLERDLAGLQQCLVDFADGAVLDPCNAVPLSEDAAVDRVRAELSFEGQDFLVVAAKGLYGDVQVKAWASTEPVDFSLKNEVERGETRSSLLDAALDKVPRSQQRCSGSLQACGGEVAFWLLEPRADTRPGQPELPAADRFILNAVVVFPEVPAVRISVHLPSWSEPTIRLRFVLLLKFLSLSTSMHTTGRAVAGALKMSRDDHARAVEKMHLASRESTDADKERYRNQLYDRSKAFKIADSLMRATLAQCAAISSPAVGWVAGEPINFDLVDFVKTLCEQFSGAVGMDVAACMSNAAKGVIKEDVRLRWIVNGTSAATHMGDEDLVHLTTTSESIVLVNAEEEPEAKTCTAGAARTAVDDSSVSYVDSVKTIRMRSPKCAKGTIIVPVVVPFRSWTLVLVVNPLSETRTITGKHDPVQPTAVLCLSVVRAMLYNMFANQRRAYESLKGVRDQFVTKAVSLKERYALAKTFNSLKTAALRVRSAHGRERAARIHVLERNMADRTEMVRTLSVAAAGVENGVVGVWSHTCRLLMTMLSGHLSVTDVGLAVKPHPATGETAAREYVVQDMSTPEKKKKKKSDGSGGGGGDRASTPPGATYASEDMEYSLGNIESRTVAEIGGNVPGLIEDLVSVDSFRTFHGTDPVIKLKRSDDATGEEDEHVADVPTEGHLWLVPVRTSRNCLGVLRVAFKRSRVTDAESTERLKYAQDVLVGFSEIVAPLLAAGKLMDDARMRGLEKDEELFAANRVRNEAGAKVSRANRRAEAVLDALDIVGKFVRSKVPNSELNLTGSSLPVFIKECLEGPVGAALNREVVIDFQSGRDDIPRTAAAAADVSHSARASTSLAFIEVGGDVVGSVRIGLQQKQGHLADGDGDGDDGDGASDVRESVLEMQPVASLLAATVSTILRESRAKARVTETLDGMALMQDTVEGHKGTIVRMNGQLAESTRTCGLYRSLSDILNRCVMFTCTEVQEDHSERAAVTSADVDLKALLGDVCRTVKGMADVESACSVAVPSAAPSSSDAAAAGGEDLTWFHAGEGRFKDVHFPDGVEANDAAVTVVWNLAKASLTQGHKSSVRVGVSESVIPGTQLAADGSEASLLVSTFPILAVRRNSAGRETTETVAVLQLTSAGPTVAKDMEGVCEDVCYGLAFTLTEYRAKWQRVRRNLDVEEQFIITSHKADAAVLENKVRIHQLALWRDLDGLARSVHGRCAAGTGHSLAQCVLNDNARDILQAMGATVKITALPEGQGQNEADEDHDHDQDDPLSRRMVLSAPPSVALVSLVPGLGSYGAIATLCTEDSAALQNVRSEVLAGVLDVIQSAEDACRSRDAVKEAAAQHANGLKLELDTRGASMSATQDELNMTARNLVAQQRETAKWKGKAAAAVATYCVPAVDELVNAITEVGGLEERDMLTKAIDSSNGRLDRVWNDVQRITYGSITRVTKADVPCHVSVLVRSGSPRSTNISLFDGTRPNARHVTVPNGDVPSRSFLYSADPMSVVEKCFRAGGEHSSLEDACKADLAGISPEAMKKLFVGGGEGAPGSSKQAHGLTVCAVPIVYAPGNLSAVLRIVYPDETSVHVGVLEESALGSMQFALPVASMVATLGNALVSVGAARLAQGDKTAEYMSISSQAAERMTHLKGIVGRMRRVYRSVGRESLLLIDAPLPSNMGMVDASLRDMTLKLLGMVRSHMASTGQAVLLLDHSTNPSTFRVICLGAGLTWPGVSAGAFGLLSAPAHTPALVTTAMTAPKCLVVPNVSADRRYFPGLDGIVPSESAYIAMPFHTRDGAVVGVLVATRATPFTADETLSLEVLASVSSLAVHWGRAEDARAVGRGQDAAAHEEVRDLASAPTGAGAGAGPGAGLGAGVKPLPAQGGKSGVLPPPPASPSGQDDGQGSQLDSVTITTPTASITATQQVAPPTPAPVFVPVPPSDGKGSAAKTKESSGLK